MLVSYPSLSPGQTGALASLVGARVLRGLAGSLRRLAGALRGLAETLGSLSLEGWLVS